MAFDVDGAIAAGYTHREIADYLAQGKFNTTGARQVGYSDEEIIQYLNPQWTGAKSSSQPEPSHVNYDRGMLGDIASRAARGGVQALKGVGGALRMSDLDPESDTGMVSSFGKKVTDFADEATQKYDILKPDMGEVQQKEGFVKRGFLGGVESVPASLLPIAGGAATGAAAGSLFGPVGTAAGGIIGAGVTLFGTFGLGEYQNTYDESKQTLLKKGVGYNEAKELAHDHALTSALAETGGEAVGDVAGAVVFKAILKTAVKNGIKQTIKQLTGAGGVKEFGKNLAKAMPFEVGSEVGTAYVQAKSAKETGVSNIPESEAMAEAVLPAAFMSLMFGASIRGLQGVQARGLYSDLNGEDPVTRANAAVAVSKRMEDVESRRTWLNTADQYIKDGKPIPLDKPIIDFAIQKAEQESAQDNTKQGPSEPPPGGPTFNGFEDFAGAYQDGATYDDLKGKRDEYSKRPDADPNVLSDVDTFLGENKPPVDGKIEELKSLHEANGITSDELISQAGKLISEYPNETDKIKAAFPNIPVTLTDALKKSETVTPFTSESDALNKSIIDNIVGLKANNDTLSQGERDELFDFTQGGTDGTLQTETEIKNVAPTADLAAQDSIKGKEAAAGTAPTLESAEPKAALPSAETVTEPPAVVAVPAAAPTEETEAQTAPALPKPPGAGKLEATENETRQEKLSLTNIANAIRTPPPIVKDGFVRVYRGESSDSNDPQRHDSGRFWTRSLNEASSYGDRLWYLDIPADQAGEPGDVLLANHELERTGAKLLDHGYYDIPEKIRDKVFGLLEDGKKAEAIALIKHEDSISGKVEAAGEVKAQAKAVKKEMERREKADNQVNEYNRLRAVGAEAIPGIRPQDAEGVGRTYEYYKQGGLTDAQWQAYVEDLGNSNKIDGYVKPSKEAPVKTETPIEVKKPTGKPNTGTYEQPSKGYIATAAGQKYLSARGSRVAMLSALNEQSGRPYTDFAIKNIADENIDAVRDWLIEKQKPAPKAEGKPEVIDGEYTAVKAKGGGYDIYKNGVKQSVGANKATDISQVIQLLRESEKEASDFAGILNWEKKGNKHIEETKDFKDYVVEVSPRYDTQNKQVGANLTISRRNPDGTLTIESQKSDYATINEAKRDTVAQVKALSQAKTATSSPKVEAATKVIPATKTAEKNVTTPKEQKAYVVDKAKDLLTAALARVRHELGADSWSDKDTEDHLKNIPNIRIIDDESIEQITIDVPNDGRYKIPNQYGAFSAFLKKIKAMSTSTAPPDIKPPMPSKKPTGKPISDIQKEAWEDYKNLYRDYQREGRTEEAAEMKQAMKEEYPELYDEIEKAEAAEKEGLVEDYKDYSDTTKEQAEADRWHKIVADMNNKKITLKSLSNEFSGKTPSSKDVYQKSNSVYDRLNYKIKQAEETKETIKTRYPELYNEMFAETKFQRGSKSTGMKASYVQPVTDKVTSSIQSPPKVNVVQSNENCPEEVQKIMEEQGITDAMGFTWNGEVYLVSDNLQNEQEALRTLAHELTHSGLGKFFQRQNKGKLMPIRVRYEALMDAIYRAHHKEIEKIANTTHTHLDMRTVNGRRQACEEWLCNQSYESQPKWYDKLVAIFNDLLRAIGLDVKLSDAEVRVVLQDAFKEFGSEGVSFMTAWHGSPHDFDKFSKDKIGTGEGAQAYGSGLYFTSVRDVAEFYREKLSDGSRGGLGLAGVMPSATDKSLSYNAWSAAKQLTELLVSNSGEVKSFSSLNVVEQGRVLSMMHRLLENDEVLNTVVGFIPVDVVNVLGGKERSAKYLLHHPTMLIYLLPRNTDNLVPSSVPAMNVLAQAVTLGAAKVHTGLSRFDVRPSDFLSASGTLHDIPPKSISSKIPKPNEFVKGRLYQVELAPDEDEYLLWDKQTPNKLWAKILTQIRKEGNDAIWEGNKNPYGLIGNETGSRLYSSLSKSLGSDKAASDFLHRAGIRGIKYLDGSSRPTDVISKQMQSVYDKFNGDIEKAVDYLMKYVHETPKEKEKIRKMYVDKFNRGYNYNYVIFDESDIEVTAKFQRREKEAFDEASEPTPPEYDLGDLESKRKDINDYVERSRRSLEFPEMVMLAKDLLGGKFPIVMAKLRSAFGNSALGKFIPQGEGNILLKAGIFSDIDTASKVLAHEIGHLVDYLPNHLMTRGNILGRIASLNRYMKNYLEEFKGAPGLLTDEDRKRLNKEAREQIKSEEKPDEVIVEEIIKEIPQYEYTGITPEIILDLMKGRVEGKIAPELYEYLQRAETKEKKQIVLKAMKDMVDERVAQFGSKKQVGTETVRETVERVIPGVKYDQQTIYKRFKELLQKEVDKRVLYRKEVISDELKNLTKLWSPFDDSVNSSYRKYRWSSKELYADAFSVFINYPELMQKEAPTFYKAFLSWIESKPEVKETYDAYQKLAFDREAVQERREKYIYEMQKGHKTKEQEVMEQIEAERKISPRSILRELYRGLIDRNIGMMDAIKKLQKAGKISSANALKYFKEERNYLAAEADFYLEEVKQKIIDPLKEAGFTEDDIGYLGTLMRTATQRRDVANPGGMGGYFSDEQIEHLKNKLGTERFNTLKGLLEKFSDLRQELVIPKLEEAGMYSEALLNTMKTQKNYLTFNVTKFMDKMYGPMAMNAFGKVYHTVGTFQDIQNPFIATIFKDISLMRAAEITKYKKELHKTFSENEELQDQIQPAEKKFNGTAQVFVEPKDPKMGMISYLQNGKVEAFYITKEIADDFNYNSIEAMHILKFFNALMMPVKALLVNRNPIWMFRNVVRDYLGTAQNIPGATVTNLLPYYRKAFMDAWGEVMQGKKLDVVQTMKKGKMLVIDRQYHLSDDMSDDTEFDKLYAKFGHYGEAKRKGVIEPLMKAWDFLGDLGKVSERAGKIAGYRWMKENTNMTEREIGHVVRSRIGTPDVYRRGAWQLVTNNLFLYSNVGKEGFRSSWESFQDDKAAYTWKLVKYNIMPKAVLALAALGAFGDDAEDIIKRISNYDKANYLVVPFNKTADGRAVYLRMPQSYTGQVLGAIMWDIFNLEFKKATESVAEMQPYSFNPVIKAVLNWGLYAMDTNPQDWYRGQNIVNRKEWDAGEPYRLIEMSKNTWNSLGGGLLYKFNKGQDPKGVWEQISSLPGLNILGSFLKESNQGLKEEYYKASQKAKQASALKSLDKDEAVAKRERNKRKLSEAKSLLRKGFINYDTYKEAVERYR